MISYDKTLCISGSNQYMITNGETIIENMKRDIIFQRTLSNEFLGGTGGFFLIAVKSPIQALIFVLFILVLQEVEGKLIYPRVVGTSIGLPGIWVLASITIGGGVASILGMLLGVPIAATIYQLLKNETDRRLRQQSI